MQNYETAARVKGILMDPDYMSDSRETCYRDSTSTQSLTIRGISRTKSIRSGAAAESNLKYVLAMSSARLTVVSKDAIAAAGSRIACKPLARSCCRTIR